MNTFDEIWRKLSNKEYREQYALSLLKKTVAFQIKTLRKKRCGSQAVLANRSQLTQGVVSRAEDQDYGNLTFNTVGRIAGGLDMAFIGRFVRFSELVKFALTLSEEEFVHVLTFEEENAAQEQAAAQERVGVVLDLGSAESELGLSKRQPNPNEREHLGSFLPPPANSVGSVENVMRM